MQNSKKQTPMEQLLHYIEAIVALNQKDKDAITTCFTKDYITAKTTILAAGQTQKYLYFLHRGIIKGYQNIDGKITVQHLIDENQFFCSLDSFLKQIPGEEYYQAVTDCEVLKISKKQFDMLDTQTYFWSDFVRDLTQQYLHCKLERVKDFQTLKAKERYLKFITQYPNIALKVSIDTIASYLGIQPQSLSRIRKELTL